jgi:hypothetical protein
VSQDGQGKRKGKGKDTGRKSRGSLLPMQFFIRSHFLVPDIIKIIVLKRIST